VLASVSLVTLENGTRTLSGAWFTFSVRMAWQRAAASISGGVAAARDMQRSRWSWRYSRMRRGAGPGLTYKLGVSSCARTGMWDRVSRIEVMIIVVMFVPFSFGPKRHTRPSHFMTAIAAPLEGLV